jgi:hypothetical protein
LEDIHQWRQLLGKVRNTTKYNFIGHRGGVGSRHGMRTGYVICARLSVQLSMILEIDNKGFVDFTQSWSTGGRMRHIDCRFYFLRELREEGIIHVNWIRSEENTADIITKNTDTTTFEKHTATIIK